MNCRGMVAVYTVVMVAGFILASPVHGDETRSVADVKYRDRSPKGVSDLPTLDEDSTVSDYLTYAAFNSPGLEAAFNRWKAAIERIAWV